MNIYSLKNDELKKLDKEFTKTFFGRRIKFFATVPAFFSIVFMLMYMVFTIIDEALETEKFVGENTACLIIGLILLAISSIVQLQYFNMLKDYVSTKK